MNEEQFESWLYYTSKKVCPFKVVIAYENGNSIIATEDYIKKYHPNAEILKDNENKSF